MDVKQDGGLALDGAPLRARALLVGDRLDTAGIEGGEVLSNTPLAFKAGAAGVVVLFRYGAAVLFGLSATEEEAALARLAPRISGALPRPEEERALVETADDGRERVPPGGPILVRAIEIGSLLVVADALAKNVVLDRDEREVTAVLEQIEPFARRLAERGRTAGGRRAILRHIGNALLVQHRLSGRVAVTEKPDVLWDRPDLERLYARLESEYELQERAESLNRKLSVISDTAQALSDIMDTARSLRLEVFIAALILLEIVLALVQFFR
jgi:uncharacterized Rmd1/YagE family protein